MLECRSFSYLIPPILHSVENVNQLLSLSQPFMRATAGNPTITNERSPTRESAGTVNNRKIVSDEKDRIIDIGHRNIRMISCLLLSTGFLSLNPMTAFAEPSLSVIESVHMRSSTPIDRTVNAVHSSPPSSPSILSPPTPSFPLLTTSIKSTPLSYSLISSSLLSLSSPSSSSSSLSSSSSSSPALSTTLTLSNALLQKPKIQIQSPQASDFQTQVNLPGNVREMIAKSASNIPG
jgi:hypothetical protein